MHPLEPVGGAIEDEEEVTARKAISCPNEGALES